jgi:predicted GTPase
MNENYNLFLSGLISEEQYERIESEKKEIKNYMFFNNLLTIKDKIDKMLAMDKHLVDEMISNGHDWANDHIATSKDDVEEVYNWLHAEHHK